MQQARLGSKEHEGRSRVGEHKITWSGSWSGVWQTCEILWSIVPGTRIFNPKTRNKMSRDRSRKHYKGGSELPIVTSISERKGNLSSSVLS